MIDFNCPHCGRTLSVPSSLAGEVERCPGCRTKIPVPPEDEPLAPDPVAPEPPVEPEPASTSEDEAPTSPEQELPEPHRTEPPALAPAPGGRPAGRPRYSSRKRKRQKRMLLIGGGTLAVAAVAVALWIWWPGDAGMTVLRHARSASLPTRFGRTIDPSGQPYLYLILRKPDDYKPSTKPRFRFTGPAGAELECVREIESGDPVVMAALKEILSGAWGDKILAADELLVVLKTPESADSVTIRPAR
jgi:hypothetical protein